MDLEREVSQSALQHQCIQGSQECRVVVFAGGTHLYGFARLDGENYFVRLGFQGFTVSPIALVTRQKLEG